MLPYLCRMEAFFNISLPTDWQQLSDCQLLYFFHLLSKDIQMEEILTLCLFKWANLSVCCRFKGNTLIKHGKQEAWLSTRQIQSATATLDFLRSFPPFPTRITKIGKATAIAADFQQIPFSTFIAVDNYYQGFLHTKNINILKGAAPLLYPKIKQRKLTTAHLFGIFYWIASLKQYFARQFRHFFTASPIEPSNLLGNSPNTAEEVKNAMNAQIRALTGGDITKESAVLAMDTWRALTELDAKAKEVEDFKRSTK